MNKKYFLKKKIVAFLKAIGSFIVKAVSRTYKLAFTKRTILFVTNQKIRSITLGPVSQGLVILTVAWVGNLFIQSLHYNDILSNKSKQISKLKSVNKYFEEEFGSVNEKLKKINEYLISTSGNKHKVKAVKQEFQKPENIDENSLSKEDKQTFNHIKKANFKLSSIRSIAKDKIKKIEKAISITGLNVKDSSKSSINPKLKKELSYNFLGNNRIGQGGPTEDDNVLDEAVAKNMSKYSARRYVQKVKFKSEIDYLIFLEKVATVMPFSKPMRNYYISSGFGYRLDPLTRRKAPHRGLDFVGGRKEKVISPSEGVVVLAGRYSNYGKAIVIDHGFGITTRYGHLSKINVKEGQVVNKGELIGFQGSTGRSTGPHLHYEVRYKNSPLNPRKFLKAGEVLFNDKKSAHYVNS